jgi:hypothetical protein
MEELKTYKFSKEEIVKSLNQTYGREFKVEEAIFSRQGVKFGFARAPPRKQKEEGTPVGALIG